MIEELHIRDLGVIEDVTLELAPGLNVLTGETGAGKTMVVSALELLVGGRAGGDQVRSGAVAAHVEARLRPAPTRAGDWLDEDDEELVAAREVTADARGGRSRARVGGRLAPVSALAETVGAVVELHGQSDSARLAGAPAQRGLLDRFGGPALTDALAAYNGAFASWREAQAELSDLVASERDRAREVDRLAFEVDEIDAVTPVAGEEGLLDAELARLEHAEALVAAAVAAGGAIADEGGARDRLGTAVATLRGVGGVDPELDELLARAEGVAAEAQELALDLTAYGEGLALDPARLEVLRARRADLARLVRKYGADAGEVAAYAETARARLADLRGGEDRAAELRQLVEHLTGEVDAAGTRLADERRAAGKRLAGEVEAHLAELAMGRARMEVAVEPAPPGPQGADRITFLLAANPGEAPLPLGKTASGGERSRVALALRLALAAADETPVLVFDEVDAGVGGGVALELGRKLARLARGRQVLCVTHLAQLAAFADAHFRVTKAPAGQRTVASVERLDAAQRVVELSRMLSGTPDSSAAATHAGELLALADADRASFSP